jgi:hypothetical protein
MGPFAVQLQQTSRTWASAVAPLAEMVSRMLWLGIPKQVRHHRPPTHLTQVNRRESKAIPSKPVVAPLPHELQHVARASK